MSYILRREQWIERPIDEVFAFFSDAHNLERITPPFLNFKILSVSTPSIKEGTLIRYRLGLHGIPVNWLTEICAWNPPYRFVDDQLSGPYKRWHHTHTFAAHGNRTKMTDEVQYEMVFGILGRMAHAVLVHRDVKRIFDYRYQQIEKIFGKQQGS